MREALSRLFLRAANACKRPEDTRIAFMRGQKGTDAIVDACATAAAKAQDLDAILLVTAHEGAVRVFAVRSPIVSMQSVLDASYDQLKTAGVL